MASDLDRSIREQFPDVGEALERRGGRIIEKWQERLRGELPNADKLTSKQLADDMPLMLGWMCKALKSEEARPLQELLKKTPKHGETRFHQEFNLDELLIEYNLLREIILKEVSDELKRMLDVGENTALNLGLDVAMRQAAVAFADHQAAKLKAEAESQAKYLSFLSHDLRGGLNGVLLMIEVLRRDLEPSGQFVQSLEDLDVMKRTILETVGMMERFLHSERLRRGLFVVKPARVDIRQFLATLSQQFVYQAREKGVKLMQEVPAGVVIHTDREVLAMVLGNLVSNAVKYSEKGMVRVGFDQAKGRFYVADEGPGIEKGKLDELFAPFVRGDTHGVKGVGLGLSIARQGADMLGAKLWAESDVGKGSTFYLELGEESKKLKVKS